MNLQILWELIAKVLLFFLIFGMSATVETNDLKKQISNKFAIGSGILMQYLVMPFLGYMAVATLSDPINFPPSMGMTLLIVTSSPGGSFSNWFCSVFNADLALSVTMTAISTLLATFLLPANLILYTIAAYGGDQSSSDKIEDLEKSVLENLDWLDLFITLAVVICAILFGLYASIKFPTKRFHRWANGFGSFSGIALVVYTFLLGVFTGNSKKEDDGPDNSKIWNQSWTFYVGVAIPCIGGLIIANILSVIVRLTHPERVTISIECCYQNVGIATSAAVSMFNNPEDRAKAICVPLFYGFIEAVILGIYCIISWKLGWTKAPRNENFCVMISHTYEVADDSEDMNEFEDDSTRDDKCLDDTFNDDVTEVTETTGTTGSQSAISGICTPLSQAGAIREVETYDKPLGHLEVIGEEGMP